MVDTFALSSNGLSSPIGHGFQIVPNDANDLSFVTRQIRVTGASGNVVVVWLSGAETTEPVAAGDVLNWRVVRVKATGTTATGLRGYC